MISLHVTVFDVGNGKEFKVMSAPDADNPTDLVDVSEEYDIVGVSTKEGREGFAVIKKAEVKT